MASSKEETFGAASNGSPDDDGAKVVHTLLQGQAGSHSTGVKHVGLVFKGLTVSAPPSTGIPVKTLPRAIVNTFGIDQFNFLKNILRSNSKAQYTKPILSDFTGIVKPGEMLFVLGRPGSGCSTLLRTTANRSTLAVTGDLSFAGIPHASFGKKHPRESIYLPEEDRHIAALTVDQTLRFALRMNLPPKLRNDALVENLVSTVGRMFGLEHVLNSPVGGAFFPGVSGGERKRVSIAEVLAAGSTLQCFDNSTRGLDSSTALDFVKALRKLTDVGQKTTLATLYQAGEGIYEHFDKVTLLDQGHQIFFGRADEVAPYFEQLGFVRIPGQTTAEFLTMVTDPAQRQMVPGSHAEHLQSPQELATAFKQSNHYSQLLEEIREWEAQQTHSAPLEPSTSYALPYYSQVIQCLRREYQLVRGQIIVHYVKWITTVILCLSIGSMYFDLGLDSQGAFARGGIMLFSLMVNGWFQFPELFDAHTNRPVLERQASLNLYRPSAVVIARFLIDLPLIAFQNALFVLIFYFMTRLQMDAGKFFFFYLTVLISTVCFSNLLRMFAYFVPSLDDCFRYGGTACTILILFCGFLVPVKTMRPYFGWLHWINPMYYGYENLLVSEFQGLVFGCDQNSLIPQVSGASVSHQTCTISGAVAGQNHVTGAQYVNSLGYHFSHRWRNIGIMIAIGIAYMIVSAAGSEFMHFTSQGGAPIVYAKKPKDKAIHPAAPVSSDPEKSAVAVNSTSFEDSSAASSEKIQHHGPALSWKNLTVDIGEKRILHDISAYVRPGDFVALCGASGAGKTTLLTALSQTNFSGNLGGDVRFGNSRPGRAFKKIIGFAQQMDLHDGTATIREALEFSALLRQPRIYTKAEKLAYVERVLDLLNLRAVENALIGDESSGLGVEVIKKVTIAVELAARPNILFADEPTSGLDSQSAAHIVGLLGKLASQGQAILVTIHQPSASLFAQFDRLLALSSDGHQLYFGPSDAVIPYFEKHGAVCPKDANPAEFVLETVGAGINARTDDRVGNWAAIWEQSPEATTVSEKIQQLQAVPYMGEELEDDSYQFNSSTLQQTKLLTTRILKNQWRNVPYMYSKIWVHFVSGILVGFTFYNLGTSPSELQNRAFSVYFIVFLVNAIVNTILARFFFARLYWEFREGPSNTYNWQALCSASLLAEMPGALFCGVLYYILWYFPSGLPTGDAAGYIFLVVLTYEVFQVALGLFMMAMSPDLGFAGNVLVFIVCTANWFNGIILPYTEIQVFWRYWLYYLSPFTYLLSGMVTAVTKNQDVHCNTADLLSFTTPSGQTCQSYAGDWVSSASAQLLNPSSTTNCTVCKWTNGNQYLEQFKLGPHHWGGIWALWAIFLLFTMSNIALVYFFTWATKVRRWKIFYFF